MAKTFRVVLMGAVGLLLAAVAILLWPLRDAGRDDTGAGETAAARSRAVARAAGTAIPGARFLAVEMPTVFGDERQTGPAVTFVRVTRRRLDFSDVLMDDRRGGAVEALLALSEARGNALAQARFQTMAAEWIEVDDSWRQRIDGSDLETPMPPPPRPPSPGQVRPRRVVRVQERHESDSGSGGGVTQVDLNVPRIAHYRIYVVPRSGATLFVRDVIDQRTMIVESEFSYSDRTLFDVDYPTGSYIVGREPGGYRVWEKILPPE